MESNHGRYDVGATASGVYRHAPVRVLWVNTQRAQGSVEEQSEVHTALAFDDSSHVGSHASGPHG